MAYQPIENYGVIGNMHTAALVGMNGSIDWFCYPHFDSPSVFGSILDEKKGGYFRIASVKNHVKHKQFYWPDTNVLVTRFFSKEGVGEIRDYMPVGLNSNQHGYHQLVRNVSVVRGVMDFEMDCFPAFDYAREDHKTTVLEGGALFSAKSLTLGLATHIPLKKKNNGVTAKFKLKEGQSTSFVLHKVKSKTDSPIALSDEKAEELFKSTVEYWQEWISKCTYKGRWREMVQRSALVLKLLTFNPTGAIIASPTTSLPEDLGGGRNWDYRYTWIRDAAFTVYALMRIGFTQEAASFMGWLEDRCKSLGKNGSLQTMYSIEGNAIIREETLDHLEGYKKSSPVRIGNHAYNQLQLDIYGELMDSVYLYNKYGSPISYSLWKQLRRLTNWISDNWDKKDEGIWEVRGGRKHFVYSKLMSWIALDRALRLAEKRSFPADRAKWTRERDKIYEEIMNKGWSKDRQAFVQSYGSDHLDAANLIMPLVFFVSPNDPRILKTIDAIMKSPKEGGLMSNSLVHRYDVEKTADGLDGNEGTFNICSFWLVESLTRAGKMDKDRLAKARLIFEQMLGYSNHLGLYAEETGPNGEALGNFPQGFTHLGLISAAFNLDKALGEDK